MPLYKHVYSVGKGNKQEVSWRVSAQCGETRDTHYTCMLAQSQFKDLVTSSIAWRTEALKEEALQARVLCGEGKQRGSQLESQCTVQRSLGHYLRAQSQFKDLKSSIAWRTEALKEETQQARVTL